MSLELEARIFATEAHASIGQKRKYTGEDYIVHPERVVQLLTLVKHTPEMLAAGWLHDVVEDVKSVSISMIRDKFGNRVASLVAQVTDVSKPSDGNRKTRKSIDLHHLSKADAEGKTIKLADIADNSLSIERYDPDFSKVWRYEKCALLSVLMEGDPQLYYVCQKQLDDVVITAIREALK